MKLKKADEVKVFIGKDKGKTGTIDKVLTKSSMVLISGVNQYKRHKKAKSRNEKSEIITITKPIPIANVMLICPKCHLPTRVGYQKLEGKKTRICKKCEQEI